MQWKLSQAFKHINDLEVLVDGYMLRLRLIGCLSTNTTRQSRDLFGSYIPIVGCSDCSVSFQSPRRPSSLSCSQVSYSAETHLDTYDTYANVMNGKKMLRYLLPDGLHTKQLAMGIVTVKWKRRL